MEEDDPWFWTVDRVVKELCTEDRSWTPQTQTHSKPDPSKLEKNLREQQVTGSTLLDYVNDELLKSDFDVKILGQRAYLLDAIDELKSKSTMYLKRAWRKNVSHPSSNYSVGSQLFPPYGLPPGFQPPIPTFITPQSAFPNHSTPGPSFSPHPYQRGQQDPETPTPEGSRAPGPGCVFSDAGGNKRLKLATTGQEDVHLMAEDISMPQDAIEPLSMGSNLANTCSVQQDGNSNSDGNGKKRKRISPTLVSEVIDKDRNREVPTNADHVILHDPDSIEIEPGVPFTDENGEKRLVPIHQPIPGSYKSLLQGTQVVQNQALNNGGMKGLQAAELIVRKMQTNKAKLASTLLPLGYLGRQKIPIDSLFYPDTGIQQELPRSDIETTFSGHCQAISSGRRLYVHRAIKHFLMTEPKVFLRNNKVFYATIPYPITFAPRHTSASFTLHFKNNSGRAISQREALSSWPEVDPEAPKNKGDDNHVIFNVGISDLEVNRNQFDPDSLEKYRFIPGGDEVLPLYGESDEENEYDEETWREMEKERGEKLEQPLKTVKKKLITIEDINKAIDEGIAEMIVKWNKQKLPKKEHKAFRLWNKCHKKPAFRVEKLKSIQSRLGHLNNDRIPKLRKEIAAMNWSSQLQVRKQTRSMEQSIFERESLVWRQSTILQKTAPEKFPARPPAPSNITVSGAEDNDDGESISFDEESSSSDESMDDFVVDDGDAEVELDLADSEGDMLEDEASREDVAMADDDRGFVGDSRNAGLRKVPLDLLEIASSGQDQLVHDTFDDLKASSLKSDPNQTVPSSTPTWIDLTVSSGGEHSRPVDLGTPEKKKTTIKLKLTPKPRSPIVISDGDDLSSPVPDVNNLPHIDDPLSIAKYPYNEWTRLGDRTRLVISVLQKGFRFDQRVQIISLASSIAMGDLWHNMTNVLETMTTSQESFGKAIDSDTVQIIKYFLRLFWIYITCKNQKMKHIKKAKDVIEKAYGQYFESFYQFGKTLESCFGAPIHPAIKDDDESDDGSDDGEPRSATKRRQVITSCDDSLLQESPTKTKKPRKLLENVAARVLRENNQQRQVAQEKRRAELRSKLANSESYASQHDHIIINEGKFEYQGLVHVNEDIGRRIKPHQIAGVRFMWNQIVTDEDGSQGCLLAHTMGLGKTMQVITLLVAIAETSQSIEENMYSQIPERLRESKTVILCPPALVDNWMDELLLWAPKGILGELRKIDATNQLEDRLDIIQDWYHEGGILVIGYEIFSRLVHNQATEQRGAVLNQEQHTEVRRCLLDGPSIIIADEAHKMKNPVALVTKAALDFKSTSRIALTGSPLANNVEEYFSMINWVAPNYLGPIKEFRHKYAHPIQAGLYSDSSSWEKRQSLKCLEILKEDVAPKINRADMSVISDDLPPKQEFVITVPLTELQIKAYIIFVKEMLESKHAVTKDGQVSLATMWSWLSMLSLICNHPQCFSAKLNQRREEARNKNRSDEQQESTETDDRLGTSVSLHLLKQTNTLFASEASNLVAPELSNKVKVLFQILDASKAIGDKVLVFSQSIPTLDFLEDICKAQGRKYARLDGKTQSSKRQARVKRFNAGDDEIYLISTNAGGLGLNLQGANRVVIFDFKFNPVQEQQAIGRAWRLGQKKNVFVYRLVSGGTFETLVHNKTIFKMQLASRVVDKKHPLSRASSKPADYLFEPKNVEQQDLSEFKKMDPYVLDEILASQTNHSTIRSIVQSDTFEIEDDDKLTPAERVEVTQIRADEQLRQRDPAGYQQVMLERRAQANAAAERQAAIRRPNKTQGHSVSAAPKRSIPASSVQPNQYNPTAFSSNATASSSKTSTSGVSPNNPTMVIKKPKTTPLNSSLMSSGQHSSQTSNGKTAALDGSSFSNYDGNNSKSPEVEFGSIPRKRFPFDPALRVEFSQVLANTLGDYSQLVTSQKRAPEDRLTVPILRELVARLHGNPEEIHAMTKAATTLLAAKKDKFRTALGTGQMTPSDFVQHIIDQGQNLDKQSGTSTNSSPSDNAQLTTPIPSSAASGSEGIQNVRIAESSPHTIPKPIDQGTSSGVPDPPRSISSENSPRPPTESVSTGTQSTLKLHHT